jgi:hypothetical protein
MRHESRLRSLETTVRPPLGIGSLLDEPCGWCGSRPVRLRILMRNAKTGEVYPPPVGMVGCRVCHRTGPSEATLDVGATEGWFVAGGWVHEFYRKYPRTADDMAERDGRDALALARATAEGPL